MQQPYDHGHDACSCAHHARGPAVAKEAGLWPALLAVLACAVCPACVTTYAKLLSILGVAGGLSETQHLILLSFALTASIAVSAWRSLRSQRVWPLAVAVVGSSLVLLGHFAGELAALEWAGVVVLLVGGMTEHLRLRRANAVAAHA